MKKRVFPSWWKVLILMVLCSIPILFLTQDVFSSGGLLWVPMYFFSERMYFLAIMMTLAAIVMCITVAVISVCTYWFYLVYCRPVTWDRGGIRQGILFRQKLSWSDGPRIGITALVCYSPSASYHCLETKTNPHTGFWGETMIYVTEQGFSDNSIEVYGVLEIFAQKVLKDCFPWLYRAFFRWTERIKQADLGVHKSILGLCIQSPKLETPRTIIFLRYTPERFSELTRLANRPREEKSEPV